MDAFSVCCGPAHCRRAALDWTLSCPLISDGFDGIIGRGSTKRSCSLPPADTTDRRLHVSCVNDRLVSRQRCSVSSTPPRPCRSFFSYLTHPWVRQANIPHRFWLIFPAERSRRREMEAQTGPAQQRARSAGCMCQGGAEMPARSRPPDRINLVSQSTAAALLHSPGKGATLTAFRFP
jgi:hypothetical protein